MTTLNSTSILALIIAQNPYHIISIQGQMPMSHAQNTYDFEIAEDDPHYKDNFDEEEHAEEIDYYLNFLEEPETLYTFTENIISLFKSFIK